MNTRLLTLLLFVAIATSCSKYNDPSNTVVDVLQEKEAKHEIPIGRMTMTPIEGLRSSSSEQEKKLTFFDVREKEGISVYIKEERGYSLCDVDNDGETDFIVKVGPVTSRGTEVIYYDKNKNPLQIALVSIDGNRASLDVVNSYGNPDLRALFGGGRESWKECFERRMSSAHGIVMVLVAGAISGVGALGVGIGGALSCALYDPF